MEKKEHTPVFAMAAIVATFLGVTACGIVCFTLAQSVKSQRRELGKAREQLGELAQSLSSQRQDLNTAREQLADVNGKLAEARKGNQTLSQQMTEIQSKLHEREAVTEMPFPQFNFPVAAPDVAAADSLEGQLKADGKHWEPAPGQIVVGMYVQDTLEGRLNRPKGRGRIGKVVSIEPYAEGRLGATMDFGRGYVTHSFLTELTPIRFVEPDVR